MGGSERKGVWAIKSCPQMAGSGPSRSALCFGPTRWLTATQLPPLTSTTLTTYRLRASNDGEYPYPRPTPMHVEAESNCICRLISPTCVASSSRPERRSRRTSTPEQRYGPPSLIYKLNTIPNEQQFYNLVLFISSVAVFSLAAQRMSGHKASR